MVTTRDILVVLIYSVHLLRALPYISVGRDLTFSSRRLGPHAPTASPFFLTY